jgi:phosphate acyltransferase
VVVTDGFTGNVALKSIEGVARFITGALREEFTRSPARKLGALAAQPALQALKARLDPGRYNGASLVGLSGIVIKSHGGADAPSFAQAVVTAVLEAQHGLPARISAQLQPVSQAG